MNRKPLILGAFIALICLAWYYFAPSDKEAYQGYIEGEFLYIAPEEGGRITSLLAEEGAEVGQGQELFAIDQSVQVEIRRQAEASLIQAEANLRDLKAALRRPEELAVLSAQKERAQAQFALSQAEFERQKMLREKGFASQSVFDQAQAAFERDKAALEEVHKQIEVGELSSRQDAVQAGEAAVEAAKAALRQIETRIGKLKVKAPENAKVHRIFFRKGEVVNAGQPVLALLPDQNRILRFFVPESDIAKFSVNRKIAVNCDSCPNNLTARVSFISDSVEFTPPIIFSEQERAKLVYRVEAKPFEAGTLSVGLPVSVILPDETGKVP